MNAAVTATLGTGEGLYYINQDLLKQLKPDVIVTQSLCNVCSVDLHLVEAVVREMAAAPDTPGAGPALAPKIISLNPFNIKVCVVLRRIRSETQCKCVYLVVLGIRMCTATLTEFLH
jgi:hypothetical protein